MKSAAFVALVLAFVNRPASAETIDGNRIIVLDGDTVALPCSSPAPGCAEQVRFVDIDAPETFHPDCDEDLKAGLKAKARLAQLIRGKPIWIERTSQKAPYRCTLGAAVPVNRNLHGTSKLPCLAMDRDRWRAALYNLGLAVASCDRTWRSRQANDWSSSDARG